MHLIPYAGRNYSHAFEQNLLWREGNIYIMDNHRAAAWCWAQAVKPAEQYSIFHIDWHTDLLQTYLDRWCAECPPIQDMKIEEYLSLMFECDQYCKHRLFRWDNYMPIFIRQRAAFMNTFAYIWRGVGDQPWFSAQEHYAHQAPENLAYWLSHGGPWILNLDLDFFFIHVGDEQHLQMYSDEYVISIAREIKTAHEAGHIKCLTVAISPEMCGGWDSGLRVLAVFAKEFGLKLPSL